MCFTNEELLIEASLWTGAHLERSARGKWSFKGLTGVAINTAVQGSPNCNWWAWLKTATKGEKKVLYLDFSDFSTFLLQQKLLWKVFHYQLLDDYQAKPRSNLCIYGKDPLSTHSPGEGPAFTTTKQQRYRQKDESQTSAAPTQSGSLKSGS